MTITIPDENLGEALANFNSILDILYEYSHLVRYDVVCEVSVLGMYTKEIEDYYDHHIKPALHKKDQEYAESLRNKEF